MIIFINGSINAGKTTVAKILATKLSNSALLEIDVFHTIHDLGGRRLSGSAGQNGSDFEPVLRKRHRCRKT